MHACGAGSADVRAAHGDRAGDCARNPDVYACTRVLADAAASCPLIVYRRLPDGDRRRTSNRTAELLRAPAEGSTQANLVATVVAHPCLGKRLPRQVPRP